MTLLACNIAFLTLVVFICTRISDRYVWYFLIGEYLVAMLPLSVIAVLSSQTMKPIIAVFLIHIALLVILGVVPGLSPKGLKIHSPFSTINRATETAAITAYSEGSARKLGTEPPVAIAATLMDKRNPVPKMHPSHVNLR